MSSAAGAGMSPEDVRRLLCDGELEILGLLPRASNATLLGRLTHPDGEGLVVYKPRRGEAPLWDFPSGTLCLREQAAWTLDQHLGWDLVPPTVLRSGPAGFGAVQLWLEEDLDFDVRRLPDTHPDDLRRMVVFDVVANNADRKAGHCLVDTSGRLWSVDHGICFHAEYKLRTVLWGWADEPLTDEERATLGCLEPDLAHGGPLADELAGLLADDELAALRRRCRGLLRAGRMPSPAGHWPAIPWPAF